MGALNLFQARVAIGTANGVPVYVTPEFARALSDLFARVGGATGASTDDLAAELATANAGAMLNGLANVVADLEARAAEILGQVAVLAELRKTLEELQLAGVNVATPPTWEQPGKIGARAPNSGKFTTLETTGAATFNPKDANVELKPTGTGTVAVAPAQQGTVNNMQLGNATPASARVTTLQTDQLHTVTKGAKFSGAATLAATAVATFSYEHPYTRYYIGDGTGYSFRFAKRTGSATTDVATITDQGAATFVGGFGCNGKAAQTAAALGAAATDPATTQTLANNIRAALIANGIGA